MSSTHPNPQTGEILKSLGYSHSALGRTLGLSKKRWLNQLQGRTLFREEEARLVADYVGVPVLELFAADRVIWESSDTAPSRIEIARKAAA